jgi:sortase (surface protein transpeptidase)
LKSIRKPIINVRFVVLLILHTINTHITLQTNHYSYHTQKQESERKKTEELEKKTKEQDEIKKKELDDKKKAEQDEIKKKEEKVNYELQHFIAILNANFI